MAELLEWLLKSENKNTCRIVGILLLLPAVFIFSDTIIITKTWLGEWATLLCVFSMFFGLLFVLAGFSKRK